MAAWVNFKRLDLGKAPIPMSQVSQAQDRGMRGTRTSSSAVWWP